MILTNRISGAAFGPPPFFGAAAESRGPEKTWLTVDRKTRILPQRGDGRCGRGWPRSLPAGESL